METLQISNIIVLYATIPIYLLSTKYCYSFFLEYVVGIHNGYTSSSNHQTCAYMGFNDTDKISA